LPTPVIIVEMLMTSYECQLETVKCYQLLDCEHVSMSHPVVLFYRPAPTYETATTRKFYHGRTETVKACTNEALLFAKVMCDPLSKVGILERPVKCKIKCKIGIYCIHQSLHKHLSKQTPSGRYRTHSFFLRHMILLLQNVSKPL